MSGAPPPPGPADFEFLCGSYRLRHGEAHEYLKALPGVLAVSPGYEQDPQLRLLAGMLRADVAQSRPGAAAARSALMDLLLVHVLRQWHERNRSASWPELSDPAIAAAVAQVRGEPERPWTVHQMAQTAGLSRTAFTRRFSAELGMSPGAWLTTTRMARAARLLRQSSEPLAVIARQVGYSTEFAFGAAFRRGYGISPGRFRGSAGWEPASA